MFDNRLNNRLLVLVGLSCLTVKSAIADTATDFSALAKMPVKEITVFKDGHAFVAHAGRMPTDSRGYVQMDYLPTPILGTFWPYSTDQNVKLSAVTASSRRVRIEQTALNLQDLILANPGAAVRITEVGGNSYNATLLGVPERSGEEQERTNPPNSGDRLPEQGQVVLLKTAKGTVVLARNRIQDITFLNSYRRTVSTQEFRNLLSLKLEWPNGKPQKTADVGMVYLQRGLRWIPSYKIAMDGKGNASLSMQATLVNELTDLKDVTVNLVIGVPSFAFKDTIDPIGLQQTLAQLSPYFANSSPMSNSLSNGMMSQVAGQGGFGRGGRGYAGPQGDAGESGPDLGPSVAGSTQNEDTFLFTVKHVTLRKGQRMVLPVTETNLKYRDVYTVDLAFAPPHEMRQNVNLNEQQLEMLRLQNAPRAEHKIRLTNSSKYPLTTAPALILSNGKVLAQALMTYTSIGGETDIALTTAVDIKVKKSDTETNRVANAENWQGNQYAKVDLAGTIGLTNYRAQPVEVEVTRNLLGNASTADHDGKISRVNILEDDAITMRTDTPAWWGWYSWPFWWNHFNGMGRIAWKVNLDPGKSIDLNYTWNYYWR